jgi:hypothetical protein
MSLTRSTSRRSSTDAVVHAVGQRVYVNRLGSGLAQVDLMNDEGTTPIATLADGVEVIVVAWKPRGSAGTRYRVSCASDGLEGWLAAANLRRTRAVAPPPVVPVSPAKSAAASMASSKSAVASMASPARDSKPRFGGR